MRATAHHKRFLKEGENTKGTDKGRERERSRWQTDAPREGRESVGYVQ